MLYEVITLAYLVDSTAAPVAGLSLFSTWIAFQISVYAPQLPSVGGIAGGQLVRLSAEVVNPLFALLLVAALLVTIAALVYLA